jgi:hypothetical protein
MIYYCCDIKYTKKRTGGRRCPCNPLVTKDEKEWLNASTVLNKEYNNKMGNATSGACFS